MAQIQFPTQYISKKFSPVTAVAISGAVTGAGGQVNGATISSRLIGETVGARVSATAFTNGLTLTLKWQVLDDDNATWIDCLESNNPAQVALTTGVAASGGTTKTAMVTAPFSLMAGGRSCRAVVYAGGSGPAQGTGFDYASIEYDFRAPLNAYGT